MDACRITLRRNSEFRFFVDFSSILTLCDEVSWNAEQICATAAAPATIVSSTWNKNQVRDRFFSVSCSKEAGVHPLVKIVALSTFFLSCRMELRSSAGPPSTVADPMMQAIGFASISGAFGRVVSSALLSVPFGLKTSCQLIIFNEELKNRIGAVLSRTPRGSHWDRQKQPGQTKNPGRLQSIYAARPCSGR